MSFLVWVYTYQDFAETQLNFVRSHDRVIVAFRNSAYLSTTPTASLHLENINTKKMVHLETQQPQHCYISKHRHIITTSGK